jgi:hypothetical protein
MDSCGDVNSHVWVLAFCGLGIVTVSIPTSSFDPASVLHGVTHCESSDLCLKHALSLLNNLREAEHSLCSATNIAAYL